MFVDRKTVLKIGLYLGLYLTIFRGTGPRKTDNAHILHINVVINWQLSKQDIRWPVSPDRTAGSSVDPSRSSIFWSYPLTNYQFQMIAGSSLFFPMIHMKYVVFMSLWPRTVKILISNWPRTRKFSHFFKNKGGEDLFLPWSRVGHALRPISMLWLVNIWQVSSCGRFMQHL